jgi:hypothetical protein
MHVVKEEHRLVTLGQLLDGSLQIDPIEQLAQPQIGNADFESSRTALVVGIYGTLQRVRRQLLLTKAHKSYVGRPAQSRGLEKNQRIRPQGRYFP